jgi:predicted enzyme related to lactoylglutathione lyase
LRRRLQRTSAVAPIATAAAGTLAYWTVDDAAASLQALIDAGAEKVQDATDIGYGKIIAIAKDADNSMIGLLQAPK